MDEVILKENIKIINNIMLAKDFNPFFNPLFHREPSPPVYDCV